MLMESFFAGTTHFSGRRIYHKFVMYVQAKTIWQKERVNET
jgi:hypothetical protein